MKKYRRYIIWPVMVISFLFLPLEANNTQDPYDVYIVPSAYQDVTADYEVYRLATADAPAMDFPESFENDFADEFETSQTPSLNSAYDPFSSYNRAMTDFNDFVYVEFLTPAAKRYRDNTPDGLRMVMGNFFDNITFPIRFANNLLQMKTTQAAEELGRFLVNSTIGLFGFFDPASSEGLEQHPEDFGQTLGYYGVGSGFHFVLPILGPSNLRDIVGMSADSWISPVSYYHGREYNLLENQEQSMGARALETLNLRSKDPDAYEKIKTDAIDLYPFLREAYEQNRQKQIKE